MTSVSKELLAKIRKCLALASSANEHEAAAALMKARTLMQEHGVNVEDVAFAEINEASARASRTKQPPLWENILCDTIQRAMGVYGFINEIGDRTYVGRGASPVIASYAFKVLFRQLKSARSAYIKTNLKRCTIARKRIRADVFCQGWASSVHRKIAALVPVQAEDTLAQSYLAKVYPGLVPVKTRIAGLNDKRTDKDYFNGRLVGNTVDLHQGVGSTAPVPQIAA